MTKMVKIAALFVTGLLLSACTMSRPAGYENADRNSIQAGEEITVGRNQTVYGIAQKHGVRMQDIIVLNDLKPPFNLRLGQRLVLPAKNQDYAPVPSAAPLKGIEQAPLESGSTGSIASQAVTTETLEPPQTLPPNTTVDSSSVTPPKPAAPTATPVVPTKPPETIAKPAEPAPAPKKSAPTPTETASTAKPGFTLSWPVQGPVVSSFGPKGQGQNNDGVNIAAPKGAPVVAAGGGIVVYAGNEMKGFGNLVLIRHEGGWVTAYAHLERMLVNKDTVVAPGDMIGTVGSTGGVSTPQLHFETRLDGKPVDPETVVKKSS